MDVVTGQFTQVGSPLFFVLLVVSAVVALVVWKKIDKAGFNSALDKARAEVAAIEADIKKSGPEFVSELKADLKKAQDRLNALLGR